MSYPGELTSVAVESYFAALQVAVRQLLSGHSHVLVVIVAEPTDDYSEPHQCHFCGEYVDKEGYEGSEKNGTRKRHWLSDCRPDLVEHEIGETCTWPLIKPSPDSKITQEECDKLNKEMDRPWCYAYQDFATGEWGKEHIHFHKDGPL